MNSNDERKFIHDLASPLGVAIFAIDVAMEEFSARVGMTPGDLRLLKQVFEALEAMKTTLQDRREILIRKENA